MVQSGILFVLGTVNWLDVKGLTIEAGADKCGGGSAPRVPSF